MLVNETIGRRCSLLNVGVRGPIPSIIGLEPADRELNEPVARSASG
jgi:hypothetical protein